MSEDAVPLVVRRSRLKAIGSLVAFTVLMLAFGAFHKPESANDRSWMLYAGAALLVVLTSLPIFFDTASRLVLTAEGLSWREKKKDPLLFLPWNEIASADIRDGGEDEPRCLRLQLTRGSILEEVASDRKGGRKIDIPIQGLGISDRRLMVEIHRRAPHLFTRVSRRTA